MIDSLMICVASYVDMTITCDNVLSFCPLFSASGVHWTEFDHDTLSGAPVPK